VKNREKWGRLSVFDSGSNTMITRWLSIPENGIPTMDKILVIIL
jgi:hypothetical protein